MKNLITKNLSKFSLVYASVAFLFAPVLTKADTTATISIDGTTIPGTVLQNSNGTTLGRLIGIDPTYFTFATNKGFFITVDARTGAVQGSPVWYASNNCSGKPYASRRAPQNLFYYGQASSAQAAAAGTTPPPSVQKVLGYLSFGASAEVTIGSCSSGDTCETNCGITFGIVAGNKQTGYEVILNDANTTGWSGLSVSTPMRIR